MSRSWTLLVMLASLLPATARADEGKRTIRVLGEGRATAAPDLATIQTGVVTQAETAAAALAANTKAMDKVMDTLRQFQIAAKDVQTSSLQVQPMYHRDPNNQSAPVIASYQVTNQVRVRVRVRKLSDLGQVLDALVQAGSNRVSGISFGLNDPSATLDQARRRAFEDAHRRAQLYADASGTRLGKVQTISEEPLAPRPRYLARAAVAQGGGAVPVSPGEEELQARVEVVFFLEDRR